VLVPVRLFTDAERERLNRFPRDVSPADLLAFFTLSDDELELIGDRRGDHNRLGFGLQLKTLPYLGFVPDDLSSAPARVVSYLALQLSVPSDALQQYGDREHTRTDHLQEIQARLGFRDASQHELAALSTWLLDRALEHDRPIVLFHLACQWLLQERLARPGVTRIERLVATIRERAQQETYRRLGALLTPTLRDGLDALLQPTSSTGRTPLSWLQREATALTPRAILDEIEKLNYVRGLGADGWQLNSLTPNRRKLLAGIGRRSTNQALQRMSPERRFPILLAFLAQAAEDVTDEIIDLFDRALTNSYARARRELDEFRRSIARSTNEKVVLFRAMGRVVLDPSISDADLRVAIYRQVLSEQELAAAVDDADRIMRPLDDDYFDLLADRYSHLRQFAPSLLSAFNFRSSDVDQELVAAIELVHQLNVSGRRKVPEDAPVSFVPARWRTYVIDDDGRIDRRFYELCVLWELRAALRAGDVWVEGSRRYADPDTYLIPRAEWPAKRTEACRLIGAPENGAERLRERQVELESILARLDRGFPKNDYVRLVGDDLTVAPVRGEDPPESAEQLRDQIVERLPTVDLPELLIEVDRWIGFTRAFQHAGGAEPRTKDLITHLHAAIFAQACNFGLEQMAELANLSYRKLAWCATWYLREETLKAAIAQLVNFQHRQPLAAAWGSGTLSSSDGQRFPVTVKARNATALPRYFGYGRGLTHYTWTSDQHALYGGKPIPTTARDATYVLDEILDNETELPIEQHTTDTAGYTELLFSLFDLVGLQFSPRIRDMADQRLFRLDRSIRYQHIEPLFSGTLNRDLILGRWDDLLRVAGSVKMGWVTASLLIGKLQSYRRQNALMRALQEYGRLIKTIHIVRCLDNPEYRRAIGRQLNKGEQLHNLRRFLFFANEGEIRRSQFEDQTTQVLCLNLAANAIITWNTVYMAEALDAIRAEAIAVDDDDLVHVPPTLWSHVNVYGKYEFDVDAGSRRSGLRPLRPPTAASA
jgi:TnpA family transposase